MSKKRTKRQKAIIRRRIFLTCSSAVLIAVIALIVFSVNALLNNEDKVGKISSGKNTENSSSAVSSEEIPETTATVISTGDIMVHSTQLTGAKTSSGDYDFSAFFKETASYFKAADLAVANLEGTESGKFSGYPAFNTPDSLADSIKDSGLNFLITANNHAYDTGLFGLKRTVQVLKQKGIEFTGTRETEQDPAFVIKEINNIKIGIANFTYETSGQTEGRKYLNGAIIAKEANNLINSFSYEHIDDFYATAADMISEMKSGGVCSFVHALGKRV